MFSIAAPILMAHFTLEYCHARQYSRSSLAPSSSWMAKKNVKWIEARWVIDGSWWWPLYFSAEITEIGSPPRRKVPHTDSENQSKTKSTRRLHCSVAVRATRAIVSSLDRQHRKEPSHNCLWQLRMLLERRLSSTNDATLRFQFATKTKKHSKRNPSIPFRIAETTTKLTVKRLLFRHHQTKHNKSLWNWSTDILRDVNSNKSKCISKTKK